jgi:Zn-dependent alcohol dehydrogenase
LIEWTRRGALDLSKVITRILPLDAQAVNDALDELEKFGEAGRMVIMP